MQAVRAALAPALQQFPETDDSGASPRGSNSDALWMVRPPDAGENVIEVLANPLNEINQLKASRAMAQIQRNIEAAQRRAAAQYEAALAEAKRTGKSQDVDGVTLSDEGLEGAKIDAESHVTIEVLFNLPSYKFSIASSESPRVTPLKVATGTVVSMPSHVYKDDGGERFNEAETFVFVGQSAAPVIDKTGDHSYGVTAPAKPPSGPGGSLIVHLKGNEPLMADILRKLDWNSLLELLK